MSELANKVKERLIAFIEYKELSVSAFEKACGLSNGYIRNFKGNLGGTKLEDILNAFPELDREWLLFGTTKSEDSVEEQPSGNATIDKLVTLLADKDNDISRMRSKKMKANSKTIRRMKVNVRSEESKSKHSYV